MVSKTTSIPLKRREFGRFAPDRSRVQDTDPRPPGAGFLFSPDPPIGLSRSELVHKAECLPERPSSTVERLELKSAEEKRHQVGVFDLNELVEFTAHVRDIEDLSEREVLGDRVHDLVYGFVFFHEGLSGKSSESFLVRLLFLVPETAAAGYANQTTVTLSAMRWAELGQERG